MTPNTEGWSEAEMFVTKELARLSTKMDAMDEKVTTLRVEVAQKASIYGALSGILAGVAAALFKRP